VTPPSFGRFKPKGRNGNGKAMKIIPIPGVGKGPRWLHLPEPDVMPVSLFQEAGSGTWFLIGPGSRHGPFTDIEMALTCWSVDARKA
jgi:hypothetical protein